MIQIQNYSFQYGQKQVLKGIDAAIPTGGLTAVIGLNGAGKSTLLRCLSKQMTSHNGSILIDGKDIRPYSFREYARLVSLVPQLSSIGKVDCTVRDFLVEGRTPYLPPFQVPSRADYQIAEEKAEKLGVTQYLGSDFSSLSGGQQQLVLLTRALVQDTPIVLLDEPMSALDLANQARFLRMIRDLSGSGKTVLFSTHDPNHALHLGCDVLLLKDGRILSQGNAVSCITDDNMHEIYGDSVELVHAGAKNLLALKD